MADFKICTDSTADLPEEYLSQNNIDTLHLSYEINGILYGPEKEMPVNDFYSEMRAGNLPKTSQVNPEMAKEGLLKALGDYKELLHVCFSSGLSGTYNSCRLAAMEIMEENPDVTIRVIDSKCASLGEGLLVYKLVEMRNKGCSFNEVADWAEENILHFIHLFTVDDLNHLYRGGRVSKSTALVGTVLNIKPVLHVDNEGHLVPLTKERGRKRALLSLVDGMEKRMGQFRENNDIILISHGDCLDDAMFVKEEIEKRFGVERFIINYIGPTIGSHAGPGTVALFFMGEER